MLKAAKLAVLGLALAALPVSAMADQITDKINSGVKLYEDGKISQAIHEIDFALDQLRQRQAEAIAALLPEKVGLWVGQKAKTTGNKNIMGTGTVVARSYECMDDDSKMVDNRRVIVEIMRLGQGMNAMFNPMMLQRMSGGKPMIIGGIEGTLLEKSEDSAQLILNPSTEYIFKVEVLQCKDSGEIAQEFVKAIDTAKLKELLQ